jgi:wobble nucleotide-excising tRNase
MIDKIIKIKGIGLLHDAVTRAKKFSKITILYGENARGKTTLATIFSSLAKNDPSIISGRETLDGTEAPEVEFRINNTNHIYQNGNWNQGSSNIVIFDSSFVDSNVYSGFEVSSDQRRSLLVFTLGEEGGALKNDVDKLTEGISRITSEIRNRSDEIERVCSPLALEDYLDLPEDKNIDERIQQLNAMYQSVLRADEICNNPLLLQIKLAQANFDEVKTLLSTTLSDISQEAKTRVLEHMTAHMNEQNEQWIKEGVLLINSENCPFCGGDLDESAGLIDLYQKYFDQSYQNHQDELKEHYRIIESCLSDYALSEVSQTCNNNELLFDNVWSNLSIRKFVFPLSGNSVRENLTSIRESVKTILQIKTSNPTMAIEDLQDFNSLNAKYQEIFSQIEQYNDEVRWQNSHIEQIKYRLRQTSRIQIKNDIDKSTRQKERHSSPHKDLCDSFVSLVQGKKILEEQKEQARDSLESFTNDLLEQYESEINRYLDCFNAGFRIINVNTSNERGLPRMKYQLQIRDHNLAIGPQRRASDQPGFSNTLSEGDKRTLAFSFFMAKNDLDADIANKIIIVDDPMSSLDQSRQRATQIALVDLARKSNQLILLSHDPVFLQAFIENGDYDINSVNIYEFKRAQNDYSTLEECNIEECIQSVYKRNYQTVSKYIVDPRGMDKLTVVRAIRPLIEANLRHRFQDSLKGANSLGIMISMIRSAPSGSPLQKIIPHLKKIGDINAYTTAHTHDTDADGTLQQINDTELKRCALLAMDIAQGF